MPLEDIDEERDEIRANYTCLTGWDKSSKEEELKQD